MLDGSEPRVCGARAASACWCLVFPEFLHSEITTSAVAQVVTSEAAEEATAAEEEMETTEATPPPASSAPSLRPGPGKRERLHDERDWTRTADNVVRARRNAERNARRSGFRRAEWLHRNRDMKALRQRRDEGPE